MNASIAQVNRVARRVMLALARAVIGPVNDAGGVQFIQVQLNPMETIDNVPRVAEYGYTSNPPAGSVGIVAFGSGDRSNGVVIATGNATFRVTTLASGEVCVHDDTGQKVYLSQSGMRLDGGGKQITLTNTPVILADTPILRCTGDIIDNYGANTRTVAGMRQVANLHTHPIVNVQTGGSTINTQPPTQPE